jgi:EAL domain-containing protein (putative c-di-GMP-specific phosphodiesterase class I)/GGDEF domain-containing protein
VVGAYADDFGFDSQNVMKLSTCFSGGMRHGGMCGCAVSALLVCGMACGAYNPGDKELEVQGNRISELFYNRFCKKMEGKVLCREILGSDTSTPEGMAEVYHNEVDLKENVCARVLELTCEILDEVFEENKDDINNNALETRTEDLVSLKRVDNIYEFRNNINSVLDKSEKKVAFIQFDIKRFKIINDLYGERFGDDVLFYVNMKLRDICGDDHYFMNIRSDIFMVVTEYDYEQEVMDLVKRIEKSIKSFKKVKIQFVFGVYFVEDKKMEIRRMEDRAAMARKSAKEKSMSNISIYEQQYKDSLYNLKFVEENMESALEDNQFKMFIQPKYNAVTGEIVGAEALVRWFNPERGKIYPNDFIPIIEENGFIKKVDYFMWREACRLIRRFSDAGVENFPISVNVSRHHLKDTNFIEELEKSIKEFDINKKLLELEITETVNDQLISHMAYRLKREGFTLLMDDFGSGYSSLNVLLETPFDVIKLDKKFMDNMMTSKKGRTILEYVVAMADAMGLGLVAEGVETASQVELLKKIGCNVVQGYYYSKPMPQEEFFEMLLENKKVSKK